MGEQIEGAAVDAVGTPGTTDGGSVNEPTAADTTSQVDTTETHEDAAADSQAEAEKSKAGDAKPEIPDAARKEIGRMANALAKLQAENATLKADSVTKAAPTEKPATAKQSKQADHPALSGLTPDDDGDYLVDGTYYTRDELIAKYDQTHGLDEIRARLDRMESAAQQKERQAEYNRTVKELNDQLSANVKDLRKELFPEIPAEKSDLFDNRLLRNVYAVIEERTGSGSELSEELLLGAITDVFSEERELLGLLGSAQVADNTKSKAQHPVAPGGIPGVETPKDPLTLPQRVAEAMADKAARIAESMRK